MLPLPGRAAHCKHTSSPESFLRPWHLLCCPSGGRVPGDTAPPPFSASSSLLAELGWCTVAAPHPERGDPEALCCLAPGRDLQGWARLLAALTYTRGVLMSCLASLPPSQPSCPFGLTFQTPPVPGSLFGDLLLGAWGHWCLCPFLPGLITFLSHPPLPCRALEGSPPCAGKPHPLALDSVCQSPTSILRSPRSCRHSLGHGRCRGGLAPGPGAVGVQPPWRLLLPRVLGGRGQEGQAACPGPQWCQS